MAELHSRIEEITHRIEKRSMRGRRSYLARMVALKDSGSAHQGDSPIAIVSTLGGADSAAQQSDPTERVMDAIRGAGGKARLAAALPVASEGPVSPTSLSCVSRDITALSVELALQRADFASGALIGRCDDNFPGLLIGALGCGYRPYIAVSDGAKGVGLMPVMLGLMGLMVPGASGVTEGDPEYPMLTLMAAELSVQQASSPDTPALYEIVSVPSIVNAGVGLMALGGSANGFLHLIAIAGAAGITLTWEDLADLSAIVPVIPCFSADNNMQAPLATLIAPLLAAGLLHEDVPTIAGGGIKAYKLTPKADGAVLTWARQSGTDKEVSPLPSGGTFKLLSGPIGMAVVNANRIDPLLTRIEAQALVFDSLDDFYARYQGGELNRDFVAVFPFQGPQANGMPVLVGIADMLEQITQQGFHVGLVTDGRLADGSFSFPAAIQVTPEASMTGLIGRVRTGDTVILDTKTCHLDIIPHDGKPLETRRPPLAPTKDEMALQGIAGRLLKTMGPADEGARLFERS